MWDVIARFCSRFAVLIIGLWVLAAAAGNLLVPQVETTAHNHARGFLPADAPVNLAGVQMDEQFHDGSGGNLNYLVLEGDHPLGAPERAYYDRLLSTLRADTEDVDSVMDLWSDPVTAAGAFYDPTIDDALSPLAKGFGNTMPYGFLETLRDDIRTAILDRELAEHMAMRAWVQQVGQGRVCRYAISAQGREALRALLSKRRGNVLPRGEDFIDADPVAEPLVDGQRVVDETLRGVAVRPTPRQRGGQIPVVQGQPGLDAGLQQLVDQPRVEVHARAEHLVAVEHPGPGRREPVGVEPQPGHQRHVVGVPVVVVAGDVAVLAVHHCPRHPAEDVPDRVLLAAFVRGALDLKRGRGGAEQKSRRKAKAHQASFAGGGTWAGAPGSHERVFRLPCRSGTSASSRLV